MPEVNMIDLAHVTVDAAVAGRAADVLDSDRPSADIRDLALAALQRWRDARAKLRANNAAERQGLPFPINALTRQTADPRTPKVGG